MQYINDTHASKLPDTLTPVLFSDDVEQLLPNEAQTIADLREVLLGMSRTMHEHTGKPMRSVHAKSFGLLRGSIEVMTDLPAELAQGLFVCPGHYEVLGRFSTPPAEELDDRVSLPRAFSLKVLDVHGPRLEGSEDDTTQDFLMVNSPTFLAKDAAAFLRSLRILAATTDKAPAGKRLLSGMLRGAEKALEAMGGKSSTLIGLGGHPQTHPLGETFYTQAPLRYGDYIAKISLVPVSAGLTALTNKPLDNPDHADALREAINLWFSVHEDNVWDLCVQLNVDLEKMPIEDHAIEWPEEISPYLPVARLRIPRQPAWTEIRSRAIDDGLSFSPWHALAAHRPLGNVMRARRVAYPASVEFRRMFSGCPLNEPRSAYEVLGN